MTDAARNPDTFDVGDLITISQEQAHSAALTICGQAADADDARTLLEMCGLLPYGRGEFRTYSYGRHRPAASLTTGADR